VATVHTYVVNRFPQLNIKIKYFSTFTAQIYCILAVFKNIPRNSTVQKCNRMSAEWTWA